MEQYRVRTETADEIRVTYGDRKWHQEARGAVVRVEIEDLLSPKLHALIDELARLSSFYGDIITKQLPSWEDDGGPVYDPEERRTRCQIAGS